MNVWILGLFLQLAPDSEMVWPPPPDPPRIRMVGILTRTSDIKESWLSRWVRKITGKRPPALFVQPYGLGVDRGGRLYISDHALRVVVIVDLLHRTWDHIPALGDDYQMIWPQDIAVWEKGKEVLVVDPEKKEIFRFDRNTLRYKGSIRQEEWKRPVSVAVDQERQILYISDAHAHQIFLWDLEHQRPLGSWGKRGSDGGEFNYPTFVTVDHQGWVYVTDMGNFRVQVFDPSGELLSFFGEAGNRPPYMARPRGIAVSRDGKIFLTDAMFAGFTIYDVYGRPYLYVGGLGEGFGQFSMPGDIVIDDRNWIYVTDPFNHRVQIFEYLPPEEE